jgi:hypothetical protein
VQIPKPALSYTHAQVRARHPQAVLRTSRQSRGHNIETAVSKFEFLRISDAEVDVWRELLAASMTPAPMSTPVTSASPALRSLAVQPVLVVHIDALLARLRV